MTTKNMIRWSGFAFILAGVLMVLATIIHPSTETPQSILMEEGRLITAHWLYTFYSVFVLLGLPGVYALHSREMGRTGLAGFLLLFFGTIFYAVSSDYGFNAPVLARMAPQTLDAINAYLPVAIMDALMVLCMFPGFILFGIAMHRSLAFPRWSGLLVALGWPLFIIMSAMSLFLLPQLWIFAIFGTILAGAGLASAGYAMWVAKGKEIMQPTG